MPKTARRKPTVIDPRAALLRAAGKPGVDPAVAKWVQAVLGGAKEKGPGATRGLKTTNT